MVKKSGKYGVRSGNTLRASNTHYNRHYRADSCIVRNCANLSRRQSNQVDIADDSLIDADGVLYSLNKKRRWELPKLIKENIQQDENDVKVSLYQCHKLNRQSNCVEFCSNKGQVKSVVASHGYFNGASVRNGNKGSRKKKRDQTQTGQSLQGEGEDETVPDPDPEITYDVLYPSPVTSSMSYNPKYIRNAELIVYGDGEIREAPRVRKKNGGRHRVNVVCEESDGEEWDSFDDQQSENEENTPSEEIQSPEVMLIDILESAERAKHLCSVPTKRRRVKKKTKPVNLEDEWVIVSDRVEEDEAYSSTEEASEESSTSVFHELPPTPQLESVRIILQCDTVKPNRLQEQFQDRYMEAQCQPRKFIIDTTQAVAEAMRKSKVANMVFLGSLDFSSCLVFSRDANYDHGLDVYRVQFNINSTVGTVRIETLFDLMPTSVEEVLHAAAVHATILPPESFQKTELYEVASSSQKILSIQLVPSVNKWNTISGPLHHIVDDGKEFEVISEEEAVGATGAVGRDQGEHKRPEYCNICFEVINPELFDSAPASCLIQCGHWFCDGCWKDHLSVRIHSGAVKLKCPEYKCESVVDTATLLSLVSIKHVNLHQKLRNTVDVDTSPNLKWCPNPKCGRVLKKQDDGKDGVTVNCDCGKVVCFTCLRDAHWPATCEQATNYAQKLKKTGDDNLLLEEETTVQVRGKNCPKCNRFIEKMGGCKRMDCTCGHCFCWICLEKWQVHGYSSAPCHDTSDFVGTKKVRVRHVDTSEKSSISQSPMYKMAVVHRALRKPYYVRSLRSTVNSLSIQLRGLMSKGVDVGQQSIASDDSSRATASVVHDFLVQMMQLKLELNHVIEHTAVLLEERQIRIGSRKLTQICRRLEWICTSIETDLKSKGRQELQRAVPSLSYLQSLARRGVTALVSVLALVDSAKV